MKLTYRLLILLIFLSFSLFADTVRKIESITYRSQQGATIALIQLTDGSIWKWSPDLYSENLLRRWAEGDEILIQAINHPGFSLKNLNKPHFNPIVALSFNSYLLYPTVVSCDNCHGVIELSDGAKWEILYDFNKRTLHHWSAGDRIVAVKGIQGNYELLNLDIPHENRCQIERLMEVTPFDPNIQLPPCIEEEEEALSANASFDIIFCFSMLA